MSTVTILTPKSADDFCKLYKKLQKLLGKQDLKPAKRDWVIEAIDALISYVTKAGRSMVAGFNLSQAVKRYKLPDLGLYYRSGNLHFSKTLEELQRQFPSADESEDDEYLIPESSTDFRVSLKPSTNNPSGSKKQKAKSKVHITTS